MSSIKNTKLSVAQFALTCVEDVKKNKKVSDKEYKSLVKKMSTLIQKNGYISTLVFNLSKINNTHHREVLKNIVSWSYKNVKIKEFLKCTSETYSSLNELKQVEKKELSGKELKVFESYIEQISKLNQNEYRIVTKEMMILFGWIKRFSDGILNEESENKDKNED